MLSWKVVAYSKSVMFIRSCSCQFLWCALSLSLSLLLQQYIKFIVLHCWSHYDTAFCFAFEVHTEMMQLPLAMNFYAQHFSYPLTKENEVGSRNILSVLYGHTSLKVCQGWEMLLSLQMHSNCSRTDLRYAVQYWSWYWKLVLISMSYF
jgi:hypothetical protein